MLKLIGLFLFTLLLAGAAPPAPPEASPGGASEDVFKLGDADAGVRDAAGDRLWRAGRAVAPLLRAATKRSRGPIGSAI